MNKYVVFLIFLIFVSCGTVRFLPDDFINEIDTRIDEAHKVIYHEVKFEMGGENILIENHQLTRIGKNKKNEPDVLFVHDGAIEKLHSFNGRLIKKNGDTETFSKRNLVKVNLSSSMIISDQDLYVLPIQDDLEAGDLIELATKHELTLPFLGVSFSPADLGEEVENVTCRFNVAKEDSLHFTLVNDTQKPSIEIGDDQKTYTFKWTVVHGHSKKFTYAKRNSAPRIFVQIAEVSTGNNEYKKISSWRQFGDSYLTHLDLETSLSEAKPLAEKITEGLKDPKEKMDALVTYCQENIRYEQIYIDGGEIIPHPYSEIMLHKYGDCKDYSIAIYNLASSIGLKPRLALCYRGRGYEFFEKAPVSQFNHMIVYFNYNGRDYWYDGTNRTGKPDLVNSDLINQMALVVEPGNSRLIQIKESKDNLLKCNTSLKYIDNKLRGATQIELLGQYAISFQYLMNDHSKGDIDGALMNWLHHNFSENLRIDSLRWRAEKEKAFVEFVCTIPNSILHVKDNYYISFQRIFQNLSPEEIKTDKIPFFFPYYNHVQVNCKLPDFKQANEKSPEVFAINMKYDLPPGPYDKDKGNDVKNEINRIYNLANQKYKLERR